MSLEDKAEFIIAVRNYRCENRKRRFDGFDFSVLDANSTEKILVRSIEPQTKAGFVGVDDVKKMAKEMKNQNFDRGVFISKRFTVAAEEEMALRKIQQVSDVYMPPVKTEDLYLTIGDCADRQCRAKCGNVPARKSECQSLADGTPFRTWLAKPVERGSYAASVVAKILKKHKNVCRNIRWALISGRGVSFVSTNLWTNHELPHWHWNTNIQGMPNPIYQHGFENSSRKNHRSKSLLEKWKKSAHRENCWFSRKERCCQSQIQKRGTGASHGYNCGAN